MNVIHTIETIIQEYTVCDKLGANLASNAILDAFDKLGLELVEKEHFQEDLLSVEEIEKFEGSKMVYGYYDNKNFGIDIEDNEFTLIYDSTECTHEELQSIFKYLMAHQELLEVD